MIRKIIHSPQALIGLAMMLIVFLVMVFAPFLAPNDPMQLNVAHSFAPPDTQYPLGTDELGRCVLSRLIYGARESLSMRGDRKMRYFEADLKSERPVYGSNGEIKQVLPSREDSLDRLMEENARQFAAAAESVEDVVIRKLAVDKLHTALMQLTKEERDFICALFFDEKTESEVAKGLGVSQQAVHKRKSRILKKLKNFFE